MIFFQYKCNYLLWILFFSIPAIRSQSQPVRTVPAPINNGTKPINRSKTIVVEKNKDRDGDGLVDQTDKCPDVYGSPANYGCPEKKENDRDHDGVPDETDACPDATGASSNKGCPVQAAKATIKIVSDVNAKVFVDGVARADISSAVPYLLQLDRGFFDIKIVSALYNVFELKEGYKVENNSQQDYWKVQLKDDEDAQVKIEKEKKMAQKVQVLAGLVNECMFKNAASRSTVKKYYLTFTNGRLQLTTHFDLITSKGNTNYADYYVSTDVASIKSWQLNYREKKEDWDPGHYILVIFCDAAERQVDHARGEIVSNYKWQSFSIELRDDCALELGQKLKKLLEE